MPKLAIEDPDVGPELRQVRILSPDEVKKVELLKKIKKIIMQVDALDKEMVARLEEAMDNHEEMKKLTETYLPEDERIRLGYWPEDKQYRELEEGMIITRFVVNTFRQDLKGFRIAVLFEPEISKVNRRSRLGTQMRLPGKIRHLSGYDACTTLGYREWIFLTNQDRQRLVHHELEHLEVIDGGLSLRSHDFEDFTSIFSIYGPQSESGRFCSDSLQKIYGADGTSQLNMMERTG